MPDATELIRCLKKTTLDAVKAEKPADILFGTVLSTSPLQVSVEQQLILGEKQLIVTQGLTDFEVELTVNWTTESTGGGSGYAAFESHAHGVSGKKKVTIHNALEVGDSVILLRKSGGQKFIILDKAG